MFTKCGNPACRTPFGIRRGGEIFVTDLPDGVDSPYTVEIELGAGTHRVHFFWLCPGCSRLITARGDIGTIGAA